MNVRTMVSVLVAAPALLVTLGSPAGAATPAVLAFQGEIRLTPTADVGQTEFCFLTAADGCLNGAASSGVVAGVAAAPEAVDGLQGTVTYRESCVGDAGLAATGTATITANVHRVVADSWSAPVTAQWTRAGLVAVIQGDGAGAAVFAPMDAPVCGKPVAVRVAGTVELAY